jgi:hypothetical protein
MIGRLTGVFTSRSHGLFSCGPTVEIRGLDKPHGHDSLSASQSLFITAIPRRQRMESDAFFAAAGLLPFSLHSDVAKFPSNAETHLAILKSLRPTRLKCSFGCISYVESFSPACMHEQPNHRTMSVSSRRDQHLLRRMRRHLRGFGGGSLTNITCVCLLSIHWTARRHANRAWTVCCATDG